MRSPRLSKKCSRLFIIVLLAISLIVPAIPQVQADGEAWLEDWDYRKSHTIEGTTEGAQEDYQVRIILHYGSGSDADDEVYLDSKCRTDFGDIRFTNSSGEDLLDYWIEEKIDSDNATIWIEVDSIPDDPDDVDIYIYYGKADATTTSDGDTTFAFFDSCSGFFTDLWTEEAYGGNADYSDDKLRTQVTITSTGKYGRAIKTDYISFTSGWLALRWKEVDKSGWGSSIRKICGFIKNGSAWAYVYGFPNDGVYLNFISKTVIRVRMYAGGVVYSQGDIDVSSGDNEIELYYKPATGDYKVVVDGITKVSGTEANGPTGTYYRPYFSPYTYGEDYFADDIYSRKYVSPEPTHGDWGSEESSLYLPPVPNLLFGAGFNSSSPYVELHWNHSLERLDFFEVQNSSDGDSWTYLGQSNYANYTDSLVVNGARRYYKVRACNETDSTWYNSSWSDVNFETVYFIEAIADDAVADVYMGGSGIIWICGIIIVPIVAYMVKRR